MSDTITFKGNALPLSDLRKLARGALLSPSSEVYARVDEGAAVVAAIVKKGEAVEMRCGDFFRALKSDIVVAEIISDDEQHVRALRCRE